jgi:uncharacterized membrane protein YhaH (DUF805 family)
MSSPVFISYRRSDSQHATGRLFSRLAPRYLAEADIFMDVEAIAAGADFTAALDRSLSGCQVCLVMIGPRWLTETNADGSRRIDNPNDFVRQEVAAALARNIIVIPVLVDNARMPTIAELPEPLRVLATRNALFVNHDRFDEDGDAVAAKVLGALGRSIDPELDILKLLFSFKGTIPRSQFWIGILSTYGVQAALMAGLFFALGIPLAQGFFSYQTLASQQKLLVQLASLWVLWPTSALSWKRIRDLGHGFDLFSVVLGVAVAQNVLELVGKTEEALIAGWICIGLLLVLGTLKGMRFVAHQ